MPDTPEDLQVCMALGVDIKPTTHPWELVGQVKRHVWVRFNKEGDKA